MESDVDQRNGADATMPKHVPLRDGDDVAGNLDAGTPGGLMCGSLFCCQCCFTTMIILLRH